MTDALHRCVRCGVADKDVRFVGDKDHPIHFPPTPFQSPMEVCIDALKRNLSAANALLDRCVQHIQCLQVVDEYGTEDKEVIALLADIQARGGGG